MEIKKPHILCVNPWIHDFAAYDFWAKPLGLLVIAALLRCSGCRVSYIDCLDRCHPMIGNKEKISKDGRGHYLKTEIPKPQGLTDIPRRFSRYGIKPEWFKIDLKKIPKPDLIFVTSIMTYWAPGVQETIGVIKEVFPDVKVILGGIYASLCYDHAKQNSGADIVIAGHGEDKLVNLIKQHTDFSLSSFFDPLDINTYPYPAFDLQRQIHYVPLLTSRGCPFSCNYCASNFLDPYRQVKRPDLVIKEIKYWNKQYGVKNFAFYDDALLVDSKNHAIPILEGIINSGLNVNFHTPNALHIREISPQIASLMFRAGFKTIRLGLETVEFDKRKNIDNKVEEHEFIQAVSALREAGFKTDQIGAYLLTGLPGQTLDSVKYSIKIVTKSSIKPILAYYTPIPHTPMWNQAIDTSRYDIEHNPVFTNNAIFPCDKEGFAWDRISNLKKLL